MLRNWIMWLAKWRLRGRQAYNNGPLNARTKMDDGVLLLLQVAGLGHPAPAPGAVESDYLTLVISLPGRECCPRLDSSAPRRSFSALRTVSFRDDFSSFSFIDEGQYFVIGSIHPLQHRYFRSKKPVTLQKRTGNIIMCE